MLFFIILYLVICAIDNNESINYIKVRIGLRHPPVSTPQ